MSVIIVSQKYCQHQIKTINSQSVIDSDDPDIFERRVDSFNLEVISNDKTYWKKTLGVKKVYKLL